MKKKVCIIGPVHPNTKKWIEADSRLMEALRCTSDEVSKWEPWQRSVDPLGKDGDKNV